MARRITRGEVDRRTFLAGSGAAAWGVLPAGVAPVTGGETPAGGASTGDGESTPPPDRSAGWKSLCEHVAVHGGPVQVGVILDGDRALLIDCGDGSVAADLKARGVRRVERLLLTHYHRDQSCGAPRIVSSDTRIGVPAGEREWVEKAGDYWRDPKHRWHLYGFRHYRLVPAESLPVHDTLTDGQSFRFGPATIRVVATPGHTDGSVSYLVEADGRRFVFCGDAIHAGGKLWDLHSLQKGVGTLDYHGFMGARRELEASLKKIRSLGPDVLVPSHGAVVDAPAEAIDALLVRLETCYDRYVAIAALRHYFTKLFTDYAGRPGHMPIRPGKPVPECLMHMGTTWVLRSKTKAALVMDCGAPDVVEKLRRKVRSGEIASVEGLWVTHYHDDHVDAIPEFQKEFACPCFTDRHVAEVIARPTDWKLPCISPSVARVDRSTEDGQSWNWREFTLTAHHFPGQTFYHAGLLVESGELRMFFAGDSFTPAGIDDYCAQNRNWLGAGVGFDRCVALLEKLRPTHVFNCHVNDAFDFTPGQYAAMRANLAERERLYGELLAWDHPNYGMDDSWVYCHPFEQKTPPGESVRFDVVVTNHSAQPRRAACRAVLPRSLGGKAGPWRSVLVPPKRVAKVTLEVSVPPGAAAGRHVVACDVDYHDRLLPQAAEAVVIV